MKSTNNNLIDSYQIKKQVSEEADKTTSSVSTAHTPHQAGLLFFHVSFFSWCFIRFRHKHC